MKHEKGPKKSFIQKKEGPHEEAEIQSKALRRGKNLVFSKDTSLQKERVRSKVTPRKVGVGLKQRREPRRRRLGWRLAWWGSTEKKEAPHLLGLRGRHKYSDRGADYGHAGMPRMPAHLTTLNTWRSDTS